MSTNPSQLIQQKIDAFDRRWRWLKFWEYIGIAGAAFSLLWLGIEICAWRGILASYWIFILVAVCFYLAAIVAFVAIAIVVTVWQTRRTWVAQRLESGCPGLLDRLNTLVYFEKLKRPYPFALRRSIETQASKFFEEKPAIVHYSPVHAWEQLGLFALLLVAAIAFGQHYHPFAKLVHSSGTAPGAKNDTPFELVPGSVNETQPVQKPWGEVRIVNPGHDVKLSKIDVLPLQIEMAASTTLKDPIWVTSINGGPELRHDFPPASEPKYAVYQPLIYLDELNVSDWDIVSYYAKVETNTPSEYASKIYFIEIRPFREDIFKETGGNSGSGKKKRELLNELNGLITQQTSILQQTHQYQQTDYPTEEARKQDNKKLTGAEGDLATATNHFYGKIVAENENAPIGDILDHLTVAEQQMDKAKENLGENIIPEAKQDEQGALTELVACRKSFLKVISKNPNAFGGDSSPDNGSEPPIATAEESLKAMSQVTEMHDRAQTALKSLHDLNEQQHNLAQTAPATDSVNGQSSANAESALKGKLQKLMQDNPDLFRAADSEKASLESDMSEAINRLSADDSERGNHYLTHAAGDMNDLEKAVQKNHQLQQLAEAYKLKKIIDQNIQQLGQEKNKAGSLSQQDIKAVSDSAKHATGTLKELTDTPGQDGLGPELQKSLSPENQQALQQALDKLGQAAPGADSQGAAGDAQGNLAKVSQAFGQGEQAVGKAAQEEGGLTPGGSLGQVAQQLQGLILAQQKSQPPPGQEQNKEMGEILAGIEEDMSKKNTPDAAEIMADVDSLKKQRNNNTPPNAGELKKLLDKIEAMSAEASDPNKDKPPAPEITVIDSSKFPPDYRDRIRTYYEQLSTHTP